EYDHAIRWREGERLQHIFEQRCDWLRTHGQGDHLAVDAGASVLTYDQLDGRANQLARYLISRGVRPGDRIGLLFDSPVHAYVCMLATLKVNAAYVPMDVGFPADRLAFIAQDAGVRAVLTLSHLKDRLDQVDSAVLYVDDLETVVATMDSVRLSRIEAGEPVDELCYVIYTSGTTGRPKGVAIHHASICNFVRVAVEVYQMRSDDRVYQGMTIAFDFSVEEIWVPLASGATLVPKPPGVNLLGSELWQFLHDRTVTALCCVPTLLATVDDDLPALRFLLVSGEACPRDLVARWHRPNRRFLNVYGPTEATVTATWSSVHPDRPVTIGVPLPTYTVVILDPHEDNTVARGVVGEIGIAGIGLAAGYLNRADLTDKAFIKDFVGITGNRSGRIYRTGDLGRLTEDGEIEYQGRIDTQVKIRGYRIELSEIESLLLQTPGVGSAVVHTYEPMPGATELVAYYSRRADIAEVDRIELYQRLRDHLPPYMVPAYLEELPALPMLPSGKVDRKNLPRPVSSRSRAANRAYVAPRTETEQQLAALLTRALGVEQVSADDHFFDDLGANSLLMARFCALTRKQHGLPSVAMRDVYLAPTVERLAATLSQRESAAAPELPATTPTEVTRVNNWRYVLCGMVQFLIFVMYAYAITVVDVAGYRWVVHDQAWLSIYLRSLALAGGAFVGLSVIPIAAKWLLIGRWKEEQITVWTMKYVRFWAVHMLLRFNPLMLFAGSPLYVMYLRLLGARIGRHVVILTHHMPVCTDLLTIGAGTLIRKDSYLNCYRGRDGVIETGPVSLGANSFVGEASVLDIGSTLGAGAQLGHSSSLHTGQCVPDGERWHGTPAQPATVDYQRVGPAQCGSLRRASYSCLQLAGAIFIYLPGAIILIRLLNSFLLTSPSQLTEPAFYATQLLIAAVLLFGAILAGLALVTTLPRLSRLLLKPDRTYRL
ncbi:MAG: amino acid adenylation domain-containing protein, partial [Mycobacterium sp.]|nr:amino acid adenylation domain-containing protein [Mycobacterium sp.]